jgi:hypothetical protein
MATEGTMSATASRLMAMPHRLLHRIDLSDAFCESFGFRQDATPLSSRATERIFDYAERLAHDGDRVRLHDMWSMIAALHAPLIECCAARDAATFQRMTAGIAQTGLVRGFMNYFHYTQLAANPECRKAEAAQFVDKLLSLAESAGVMPVLNPEQGAWLVQDPDIRPIMQVMFRREGVQMLPPEAGGGAFGLAMDGNVWCLKDLHGCYTGQLIGALCARHGLDQVLEIGGGLGVTAYWYQTLSGDGRRYTIYDLPSVSLMQAAFLMRSIGEDRVCLDGEEAADATAVSVRPFWRMFQETHARALWINQDSFPEIDPLLVREYVRRIADSEGCWFLSINQEAAASDGVGGRQLRVPELTAKHPGLVREYRCRDFLRHGWVEEVYRVSGVG